MQNYLKTYKADKYLVCSVINDLTATKVFGNDAVLEDTKLLSLKASKIGFWNGNKFYFGIYKELWFVSERVKERENYIIFK